MTVLRAAMLITAGIDAAAIVAALTTTPRETLYSCDGLADALEHLAMTIGEGPSTGPIADGPSMIADLGAPRPLTRCGVQAIFASPLRVGGIRLGVMDLYRRSPGALQGAPPADALMSTDLACALLQDTAYRDRPGTAGLPERTALQHARRRTCSLRPTGRPTAWTRGMTWPKPIWRMCS
jgi:hypothetical protein